ncbi:MAG: hypothetical protein JRF60_18705 [Deltaproteobacteria bacterium]|nr:hypothetical protein [Deltaproteobacteria bacterium]
MVPVERLNDMGGWLKYHAAFVIPIACILFQIHLMAKFQPRTLVSPTAIFHRRPSENPEAKPAFRNRTGGSKGGS